MDSESLIGPNSENNIVLYKPNMKGGSSDSSLAALLVDRFSKSYIVSSGYSDVAVVHGVEAATCAAVIEEERYSWLNPDELSMFLIRK